MNLKGQALILLAAAMAVSTGVMAQSVSLKSGESADLGWVYWIANCRSILASFSGVDLLEGPKEVTLAIREGQVMARRQNCPSPVPGGTVVIKAGEVKEKYSGTIRYRVRYRTEDGDRQSSHSYRIELFP